MPRSGVLSVVMLVDLWLFVSVDSASHALEAGAASLTFLGWADVAVRFSDSALEKNQYSLQTDFEWKPEGPITSRIIGRFRYEDRLEPDVYRRAELREGWINYSASSFDARVGALQEIWGKADGLRILDRVNPLNLRDLILEDYTSSRIPLWGARVSWFLNEHTWDFLVFPDTRQARAPQAGGVFDLRPFTGFIQKDAASISPNGSPSNWRYGTRLYGLVNGWDYSLNFLQTWSDTPAYHIEGIPAATTLILEPTFTRRTFLGGSFSKGYGKVVFRGEVVYSPRVETLADPQMRPRGYAAVSLVESALGLDYRLGDWLASMQYFAFWIPQSAEGVLQESYLNYISALIQREFQRGDWKMEAFVLYGLKSQDGFARPAVRWRINDYVSVRISSDILFGPSNTPFGQFHEQSRFRGEIFLYY